MNTLSSSLGVLESGARDGRGRSSIDKAMLVYEALRSVSVASRLSDLSKATGLPKSTTHRMLGALVAAGVVTRSGVCYSVEKARDARRAGGDQLDLVRRLAPFVADLLVRTRLTSSLAVSDGAEVEFVYRAYSHDNVWTVSDGTGRAAAHLTAAGRLLLSTEPQAVHGLARTWRLSLNEIAHLESDLMQVRNQRFAVVERNGLTCLAVEMPGGVGRRRVALTVRGESHLVDRGPVLFWLRAVARSAAKAGCGMAIAARQAS